jgi:hypothetical protein
VLVSKASDYPSADNSRSRPKRSSDIYLPKSGDFYKEWDPVKNGIVRCKLVRAVVPKSEHCIAASNRGSAI